MNKKQLTLLYLPIIYLIIYYIYLSFSQTYLYFTLFLSFVSLGVAVFARYTNKVSIPAIIIFCFINCLNSLGLLFNLFFLFKLDALMYASYFLINLLLITLTILDKCFHIDLFANFFTALWYLLICLLFISFLPWIRVHITSIYYAITNKSSSFNLLSIFSLDLFQLLYFFDIVLLYFSIGRYLMRFRFVKQTHTINKSK